MILPMTTSQLPGAPTFRPVSFAELLAERRRRRPHSLERPPGEPLTMAQIMERHPAQWVVLAEIDWYEDGGGDFRSAYVLSAHGDDYRGALQAVTAADEKYVMVAHRHTNYFGMKIKRR